MSKSDSDSQPVESREPANRFELPRQADIRVAADIHRRCEAALEAAGDVHIDCGSVESIDTAVLQCIGSLAGALREASRRLELVDRTEPLDDAIATLGLEDLIVGR